MIKMLPLLLLSYSATLVFSMVTTTTEAPGPDASLQEVWDWMTSVAKSQDNGVLNINMWMSGNKMSMQVGAIQDSFAYKVLKSKILFLKGETKIRQTVARYLKHFYK